MNPNPLVQFEKVTIVRNGRTTLGDINLTIGRGENVAILGPNGCGKSTLVKCISGDLRPFAGRGRLQVGGLTRWNLFDLRKSLGIVSNELQAFCAKEVTALDVVVSGFFGSFGVLEPYDVTKEQIDKAMERLEFLDADHLADRQANELSSGEGRRVLIARALVNDPSALLLDEPTTSLDLKSGHHLLQSLRKIATTGVNIVLVTHHVEEIVPEISRVIFMRQGKIALDGTPSQLLSSKNLSDLFHAPIMVEHLCGVYRASLEMEA